MGRRRFDSITAGPSTNLSPAEDGQSKIYRARLDLDPSVLRLRITKNQLRLLASVCMCTTSRSISGPIPLLHHHRPSRGWMDCFPCLEPLRSACFIPVDSRHARLRPCGVRDGRPWLVGAGEEKRGEARQVACTQPGEADFQSSFFGSWR